MRSQPTFRSRQKSKITKRNDDDRMATPAMKKREIVELRNEPSKLLKTGKTNLPAMFISEEPKPGGPSYLTPPWKN